ncbi:hypothetical protein D3C71_1659660 [compost metagenome]
MSGKPLVAPLTSTCCRSLLKPVSTWRKAALRMNGLTAVPNTRSASSACQRASAAVGLPLSFGGVRLRPKLDLPQPSPCRLSRRCVKFDNCALAKRRAASACAACRPITSGSTDGSRRAVTVTLTTPGFEVAYALLRV